MKGLKNNSLGAVWEWFSKLISDKYNELEVRAIGRIVFEYLLNITSTDILINRDIRINESHIVQLHKIAKQLNQDVPVQYITGKAYFRELELEVNNNVLIPRGETEELVQLIKDDFDLIKNKNTERTVCWDIGTGSGAIAISLAKEIEAVHVVASDINETILQTARKNAVLNNVHIDFFIHDILENSPPEIQYDCIVSNPPYVRESEKAQMQKNVLDHEPHNALFVPDSNPLIYYSSIVSAAKTTLNPSGALYVEINEALGRETAELLEHNGFSSVEIRKDMHGKERFVRGRF